MTRIIDADRLIFHSCPDMKGDCPYWGSGNCGVCQKAIITRAEIDNAPAVDLLVARGTNGVVIPMTNTSTDIAFDAGGHIYGVMGGDKIMAEFEKDLRGEEEDGK